MNTKTKLTVCGVIGGIILVSLFFIPTTDLGIDSYNSDAPPRVMVLSNQPDDFEITPIGCTYNGDVVEFQFNVENKFDDDYRLEIHLGINDKNENPLSLEAILVEIHAGETILEKHQTLFNSDMDSCLIKLDGSEKIE